MVIHTSLVGKECSGAARALTHLQHEYTIESWRYTRHSFEKSAAEQRVLARTCSMSLKRGLRAKGTLPSTKPLKKKLTTIPIANCRQGKEEAL